MTDSTSSKSDQIILLLRFDAELYAELINLCDFEGRQVINFETDDDMLDAWQSKNINAVAIISKSDILGRYGVNLIESLNKRKLPAIPVLLIGKHLDKNLRKIALSAGITDFFTRPANIENVGKRVNFLINNWADLKTKLKTKPITTYKTPFGKRAFDVFFSGLALVCLSPVFLIVYLWIKLESKGPAFYYSYRVGTGYRVFKFYKFRSMYVNADQRLKDLKHLNQYNIDAAANDKQTAATIDVDSLCNDCLSYGKCQFPLYADKVRWCEKQYIDSRKTMGGSAFIKIKDDPRITKIGNVIRNLSIDELPQLWNVFIGNMSIVGNRPLPLYEAEKLTTDKYALRFAAPAGITGLWQVEKRGKGDMSEEERLMLDNTYAQNHSLATDLKLIFKTIPALLQKENV
ncbi:sugar transferase [Mucilaginibacter sp. X5P1]|uniref:sugar transferase n=1 Tax=Mucilaginibacter sp. X5P1 TaxID=2723088 RepID=UPI0016122B9A|nr:sugar transferase [Mucilaginibacter sp. X5P1]MBB6137072.1 lipopolysaccharide/colanic/teichoic acid biosynthesis glycosyltransferase [Mucilaginibacter sp. X5P1]